MSELAKAGHNRPPSSIDMARNALSDLGTFLSAEPVITDDDLARKAKLFRDRARLALQDMEAERDAEVRPLNEQVAAVNAGYKIVSGPLKKALDLLVARMNVFARAEEDRRLREAAEARRIAEEAERAARDAEQAERDALENAEAGEVGVDVVAATARADTSFAQFNHASRDAARAERNAHVRIGGGIGRAASLRTVETLVVTDAAKALAALGLTPDIEEAIVKSARLFRKLRSVLPEGVIATHEKTL